MISGKKRILYMHRYLLYYLESSWALGTWIGEQTDYRPEALSFSSASVFLKCSQRCREDFLPGPSHCHVEEVAVGSIRSNCTPSSMLPMGGRARHLIAGFGRLSPFLWGNQHPPQRRFFAPPHHWFYIDRSPQVRRDVPLCQWLGVYVYLGRHSIGKTVWLPT